MSLVSSNTFFQAELWCSLKHIPWDRLQQMTRAWCVWAWKCEIYYPLDIANSLNKHAFSQNLYSWTVFSKILILGFFSWTQWFLHLSTHPIRDLTLFSTQQTKLCKENVISVTLGSATRAWGLTVLPVQGCLERVFTTSKDGIETGLKWSCSPTRELGAGSAAGVMAQPPQAQRCHGYAGARVWSRREARSALLCMHSSKRQSLVWTAF